MPNEYHINCMHYAKYIYLVRLHSALILSRPMHFAHLDKVLLMG